MVRINRVVNVGIAVAVIGCGAWLLGYLLGQFVP